jgi:hypothetical protein
LELNPVIYCAEPIWFAFSTNNCSFRHLPQGSCGRRRNLAAHPIQLRKERPGLVQHPSTPLRAGCQCWVGEQIETESRRDDTIQPRRNLMFEGLFQPMHLIKTLEKASAASNAPWPKAEKTKAKPLRGCRVRMGRTFLSDKCVLYHENIGHPWNRSYFMPQRPLPPAGCNARSGAPQWESRSSTPDTSSMSDSPAHQTCACARPACSPA